jgi:hypothetical protein
MWSANATNFFIPQNLTTCFGPYGPSSGDNYRTDIQYVLCSTITIDFNILIFDDHKSYVIVLRNRRSNNYDKLKENHFLEIIHFICILCKKLYILNFLNIV